MFEIKDGTAMLRNLTIGQYYSADSFVHKLDPRVKIRLVIVFIVMSLIDRNLPMFALLTAVCMTAFIASGIGLKLFLKGTGGMFTFILVCSAINLFTTPGSAWVKLGFVTITRAGLIKFGFVFWRMLLIVAMSSLLMYTTTPTKLTDGLEKAFHLSKSIAMGITIALRFISILAGELDCILTAQEARGVNFHKGSLKVRIKKMGNVILPLFQNSINRALALGEAMDAKCYTNGKKRTKLYELKYGIYDIVMYIFCLVFIAGCIVLAIKF